MEEPFDRSSDKTLSLSNVYHYLYVVDINSFLSMVDQP